MASPVIVQGATLMCSHGGVAQAVSVNPRVKMSGRPALLGAVPLVIAGCGAPPPPAGPGPCVTAQWAAGRTTRVLSMGQPLVCQTSQAMTMPTGVPVIIGDAGQVRVRGL